MKQKILLILFFLFSLKGFSQTTAAYLSGATEPWGGMGANIAAFNVVYGADWTQYNYASVDPAVLFTPARKVVWLEGGDYLTNDLISFIAANTVVITNWVNEGGLLIVNSATNQMMTPYSLGFGVTSVYNPDTVLYPVSTVDEFYVDSDYAPIIASSYSGGYISHNHLTGAGLIPLLEDEADNIVLGYLNVGSGRVILGGLTTLHFNQSNWLPKPEINNLHYRMLSFTVICPGDIVLNNDVGECGAVFSYTNTNLTQLSGLASGSEFPVGTTTNIFEYISGGVTQTCSFDVTVNDNELPVVVTQDITVQLDATGNVVITPAQIDNGSTDNCAIDTRVLDITSFDCSNIGDNTVTITVTDVNGNSTTATAVVTVEDVAGPAIVTQPFGVILDETGNGSITESDIIVSAVDNCGGTVSLSISQLTFDTSNVGDNTVTITATDSSGNISTTTVTVFVEEPLTCPANIVTTNDSGECGAIVNFVTPPQFYSVSYTMAFEGADSFNATYAEAGMLINTNSHIDAPWYVSGGVTGARIHGSTTTNWVYNGGGTFSPISVDIKNDPVNHVFVSSTGATISPTVVGIFTFPNTPDWQNITSLQWNNFSLSDIDIDDFIFEATLVPTLISGIASGNEFPIGTTTNTFEYTNQFGVVQTCSFDVTISDTEVPTALAQNITVQLDATGNVVITPAQIDNGSTDNCGIATMTLDVIDFDCSNIGDNTVTLTVTDVNGNSSTTTAVVTVEDVTAPVVSCVSQELMVNGSFETGNFSGWTAINDPSPLYGYAVSSSTSNAYFTNPTATDGTFFASNGFDGAVVGSAILYQDVTIPAGSGVELSWDENIDFDLATYCSGCLPRVHQIQVRDLSNNVLEVLHEVIAVPETIDNNNIWNSYTADLSAYAGQTIRIAFWQNITNSSSGPGKYALDNVSLMVGATLELDATGNITVNAEDLVNNVTENCGAYTVTIAGQPTVSFDCSDVGINTVQVDVTDDSGNIVSCNAQVSIVDFVLPIVLTQNITIQVNATGNVAIVPDDVNNGSTENCAIDTLTLDITDFDCSNLGDNIVTLTVTDVNGNSATETAVVTVEDTVVPIALAQNITVQLDATGNVIITPAQIDNGSTDNCAIDTMTLDVTDFDCSHVGAPQSVVLTVTDTSGNFSIANATVTVEDTVPPVVVTQDISVVLDASGTVTITPSQIDNGSTDNCEIATIELTHTEFDFNDVGANTIGLIVTDIHGNVSIGTAVVNVPLTCPANIIVNNDAGLCEATVVYNAPGRKDVLILGAAATAADLADVQQKVLAAGSFNSVDAYNTVTGTPTLAQLQEYDAILLWTNAHALNEIAVGNVLAQYIDGGGGVVDAAFDNASIATLGSFNTPTYRVLMPLGQTQGAVRTLGTVVVPAHPIMDGVAGFNGGTSSFYSSSATITPGSYIIANYDNNAPFVIAKENVGVLSARRVSLNFFPVSADTRVDSWVTSTDGALLMANALKWVAFGDTIEQTAGLPSNSAFPVGVTTNTYEYTNELGAVQTCSFTVTVNDNELPVVMTQDITVQLDATGNVVIIPAEIENGSTDNCAVDTFALDITSFDCDNVGPNTVTLTVTDIHGNSATQTAVVTVEDNLTPIMVVQDITVQLDAAGAASITVDDIDNGSSDNCAIDTRVLDITSFDCDNVGTNTVTLTITDVNGNVSAATAVVTVEDNLTPIMVVQDITVQLDAAGAASITVDDIDNGSSDNCAIDTRVLDITSFDCDNVGPNTVTLTITDVNGNISTATAVVTVEDNLVPIMVVQDITVQLDAAGAASITVDDIDNGSSDNCAIATRVLDITSFDCDNVGANTVTLTITDVNGNVSTATAVVTVEDNLVPIMVVQDITVQLDAAGAASITVDDIDNGSSDNCAIGTRVLDITSFDCDNVGANTVTLTITDVNGNVSTATAAVTVVDSVPPVVVTQDITVQLDAAGAVSITVDDIDNGSSDNCAIATRVLDITSFDCDNVGANTVTLTITDVNGNVSTATAVVTVVDSVPPVVVTQNITVQLDDAGAASIVVEDIEVSSTDACGIATKVLDITSFNCTNVGVNTVSLTVTDVNGNVTTETAVVTVEDSIAPIVLTQNIVVQLDDTGNVTITPDQIDNGSSDNCAIDTIVLDITAFDCTNVGDNTVVLTVTDVNGNTATASAIVTVQDVTPPALVLQNATIQLNADGIATLTFADIDNGSTDNCGIATAEFSQSVFDCNDAGSNFITVTVTDVNGLVSTGNVTVTVVDLLPPVAIAQNLTVELGPQGTALVFPPMVDNGSTDNCGIQALILSKELFTCEDIGVNTVTFTVVDIHDNAASVSVQLTIVDTMAPVVDTFPVIVQLGADGTVSITPEQVNHSSTDNCEIQSMSLDVSTFNCDNIGNNTVILTVTDIHGNSGTAEALVVVQDVLPATVITQPVTIALDENGQASIVAADVDGGTVDNCGVQLLHIDKTNFTCEDLGVNQVKLTAFDTAGNSSWAMAEVTVVDTIAPTAITQDIQVSLGQDGTVTITSEQINDGSFDNCSVILSLDVTTFDCSNIGENIVVLTVSDASGNTDTAEAIVTINPIAPPMASSLFQEFCVVDVPTVGDIAVNNPSAVVWYAEVDGTVPMDINTPLVDGTTYYAASNFGGCESELRIAVTVSVKDIESPRGEPIQYFCIENSNTVADIVLDQQDVVWYLTPTGGLPVDPRTPLVSGTHYYAAAVGPQCEGLQRVRVTVLVHYCDIKVNNAVSANNDGKNDYLIIEGIEYFEDNTVEIFNRWGNKVFETTHYGINDNYFKGYPNTGFGSSDSTLLPFGTYYYVINFIDHYGNSQSKTGYLHLNH